MNANESVRAEMFSYTLLYFCVFTWWKRHRHMSTHLSTQANNNLRIRILLSTQAYIPLYNIFNDSRQHSIEKPTRFCKPMLEVKGLIIRVKSDLNAKTCDKSGFSHLYAISCCRHKHIYARMRICCIIYNINTNIHSPPIEKPGPGVKCGALQECYYYFIDFINYRPTYYCNAFEEKVEYVILFYPFITFVFNLLSCWWWLKQICFVRFWKKIIYKSVYLKTFDQQFFFQFKILQSSYS